MELSLTGEKVLCLTGMALLTFLSALLPARLLSSAQPATPLRAFLVSHSFTSYCQCFAGGVFLGACLLDLLPELEEKIDEVFYIFSCAAIL